MGASLERIFVLLLFFLQASFPADCAAQQPSADTTGPAYQVVTSIYANDLATDMNPLRAENLVSIGLILQVPMRSPDKNGRPRHWILEIHFVDREHQIGGFHEELSTIDP